MIDLINTDRLSLRPITLDDVDLLVRLDSDPEVMRYLTNGKPTSRDEVLAIVRNCRQSRWVAFERATEEFVGWFHLEPTGDGEFELGYRLMRNCWDKGLATEGAAGLIAVGFRELGAQRIWAQTMLVNTRSRGVMERCGLKYVRTFHLHFDDPIAGTELGEVEYQLLRSDWKRTADRPQSSATA
jgi:RimJ/RimL family protein N-acetyltransferase